MRSVVEVGANVPAFLGKLWKLVNDSETDDLISWSPGGKVFCIKNQADFARSLLPQYYKHNNMASFIRQLNMYGFHKITSVENGGLRYEKDEIEFSHPCFMKGHAYLLEHIKRKIANPKSMMASGDGGEKIFVKPELMTKVLADVKNMKGKQESMDAKFSLMKQENEALWREVAVLRQKHIKQQQIVNNLIQFLMSLVQPSRSGKMNTHGVKRRYQLMINDAAHNPSSNHSYAKNPKLEHPDQVEDLNEEVMVDGPIIHELVHDDLVQDQDTRSPVDVSNFVSVEIPQTSPDSRPGSSDGRMQQMQYHVTMEDGDDGEIIVPLLSPYRVNHEETVNTSTPSPILSPADMNLTSPSDIDGRAQAARDPLSPSQYTISPTDMRLPVDIFASDDSAGDAAIPLCEIQRSPRDDALVAKDTLLASANGLFLAPQEITIKQEVTDTFRKPRKAAPAVANKLNLANVKTELHDADWNNMTLATVNSGNHNHAQAMYELDDHLDTMQTDLDSLRELLRSDSYSFDANTLLGVSNNAYLFGQEDPFHGLNFTNLDERTKGNASAQEQNQLMSYTGSVPDFGDFSLMEDAEATQDGELANQLLGDSSTLNTPQVSVHSPYYLGAGDK